MPVLEPFAGLRPPRELVLKVAAPPYDVVNAEEARAYAKGNPYSFFHVSRPEIDLPGTDEHADAVYAKGLENPRRFQEQGWLRFDTEPVFYTYRQKMGSHVQVGLVAAASVEEYELLPEKKGDVFDPKPWIEAFEAGGGSPLELKFLRAFEKAGLNVQKQVPIALAKGGKPITAADFGIPEKRIAIYVDGAASHTGGNLRRDKAIRAKLREASPPWTVIAFYASDFSSAPGRLLELVR